MKVLERVLEKTSTRETPSKEEEAVLCFCGFRDGI